MSPQFYFRIDEISENPNAPHYVDYSGNWVPSTDQNANIRIGGGATDIWWHCNTTGLGRAPQNQLPAGSSPYKIFSAYYTAGQGFQFLRGDATNPPPDEAWHPLSFDHDTDDFSAYLTNAGQHRTLRCQRSDQSWPRMLLPDIYHTTSRTTCGTYGGLKGDLPIFLALVAFSLQPNHLASVLPRLFVNSAWRTHNYPHGRVADRGVVVYVYTCPQEARHDLETLEDGGWGKYYP
ncbi:hypothetical protein BS50DRAFT_16725 [Corynespora cassiicola Philippines]|uniref:Uncharacterized protein n=1 Tax=Corynespora cassiicola Philippines TaxID=1448308 RepID=A0A2T2P9W5_CORCC|nr:hypothetical protein BS50DRAFT_16725 [Corynespora cassiicola Philippines]